jgi:hypothetical protein
MTMKPDEAQALDEYTDCLVQNTPEARQRADHLIQRLIGLWPQVKGFDRDRDAMLSIIRAKEHAREIDPAEQRSQADKLDEEAKQKEHEARDLQRQAENLRSRASGMRGEAQNAENSEDTAQRMGVGSMAAMRAANKYLEQYAST